MTAAASVEKVRTPEEYLAWERAQPEKHAYYRGEIFAMSGASREHNLIVGNIAVLLGAASEGRPVEAYLSAMRLKISTTGLYTYPDVSVVCGRPEFEDGEDDTLLNPSLLIEVLSPSTEDYDRGGKLRHYWTIPSLREVLLVAQDEARVEHIVKQPDGGWLVHVIGAGATIQLASIGCTLAVDDLYRRVFEGGARAAEQ